MHPGHGDVRGQEYDPAIGHRPHGFRHTGVPRRARRADASHTRTPVDPGEVDACGRDDQGAFQKQGDVGGNEGAAEGARGADRGQVSGREYDAFERMRHGNRVDERER